VLAKLGFVIIGTSSRPCLAEGQAKDSVKVELQFWLTLTFAIDILRQRLPQTEMLPRYGVALMDAAYLLNTPTWMMTRFRFQPNVPLCLEEELLFGSCRPNADFCHNRLVAWKRTLQSRANVPLSKHRSDDGLDVHSLQGRTVGDRRLNRKCPSCGVAITYFGGLRVTFGEEGDVWYRPPTKRLYCKKCEQPLRVVIQPIGYLLNGLMIGLLLVYLLLKFVYPVKSINLLLGQGFVLLALIIALTRCYQAWGIRFARR
jgi:hypothetical protein